MSGAKPKRKLTPQQAGFLESIMFGNLGLLAGRVGISLLLGLGSISLWLFKDKAQDMIERQDKTIQAVKDLGKTVTDLTMRFSVMQEHESAADKRVDEHAAALRGLADSQQTLDHRMTILESKSVLSPSNNHGK